MAFAVPAAAELNIAPGAHLTASSWNELTIVTDTGDPIPRKAVDGDLQTGWTPGVGAAAQQWLRFDFTRPWPMRYVWRKLITRWSKPPASYRWEVSRDGHHWLALAARSGTAVVDEVTVAGAGSYLRLVVPAATEVTLLEAEAYASSGGSGKLVEPKLRLSGNLAHLDWNGGSERNVFLYRLLRTASLLITTRSGTGTAGVTSLIDEAAVRARVDRIDFPDLPGVDFEYRWTVEAYAPNGERIGRSESTEPTLIDVRSPRPFAIRGIVEGYYGPGYSDSERDNLLRFTGNQGGNFYLYAPKLDPYHRDRWREPYPKDRLEAFQRWHTLAQDHGVRFAWSLSPGLDFDGSPGAIQIAVDKFLTIQALGVRWFGLLMDDIPIEADVTAAVQQVALANTVLAKLREKSADSYFIFVPTVYFGEAAALKPAQRRYLQALAALSSDIIVMWTGSEVFSPTLTHDLVDPIAELINHPILIWDNFPVADFFLGKRAHLGPIEGRAANLGEPVGTKQPVVGLLANPLALPAANRLPLASVFDYLRDPAHYDPQGSLRDQLAREAPPSTAGLLELWLAAFATDAPLGIEQSAATRAVSDAEAALETVTWPGEPFAKHAASLYLAEPALRRLYHPDLAGDLLPLAAKSARLGEAEMRLLRTIDGRARGEMVDADLDAPRTLLAEAKKSGWLITEGADERWLERALAFKGTPKGLPPRLAGKLPTSVEVGARVAATFALDGATSATFLGLPDAKFRDGKLTWSAGHTGTERWALVAANKHGAAVLFGEINVDQQASNESSGCATAAPGAWLLVLAPILILARRRGR